MFGVNVDGDIIEVAHRSNFITWQNKLAKLLDDNIKVYPLDNTPQGIYTIGDIKRKIKENMKDE
jgi:hypothetical protein